MALSSYSDVFQIALDREHEEEIRVGDVVRTNANLYPRYEVIALNGDKAWLRNVQNGQDGIASLQRCRKIET